MEETGTFVLAKSEKNSQKKKIIIAWIVVAILAVAVIAAFIIDYSGYRNGQQFGLASMAISQELYGTSEVINTNDSYEEQCEDAYSLLNRHTIDIRYNGVIIDGSDSREAEAELRSAFADVMHAGGFYRYYSNNIAKWFKYTNFFEYFTGYDWFDIIYICIILYASIASIVFAAIFTILINSEAKKELVVYEDSVLCKVNRKKSKQLLFEDISNVDFGKNSLKLIGAGIRFKISNLTNAEDIKSIILNKKASQKKDMAVPASAASSGADELKKYKELMDNGIISQEEFDAKKKQILGL